MADKLEGKRLFGHCQAFDEEMSLRIKNTGNSG
jgi:hypothetical protein